MKRLTGTVRTYSWGSYDAIPDILGQEADGKPWAEYWPGPMKPRRRPSMAYHSPSTSTLTLTNSVIAAEKSSVPAYPFSSKSSRPTTR